MLQQPAAAPAMYLLQANPLYLKLLQLRLLLLLWLHNGPRLHFATWVARKAQVAPPAIPQTGKKGTTRWQPGFLPATFLIPCQARLTAANIP